VVVVIDVKKSGLLRRHEVVTHNGTKRTGLNPVEFARAMADKGAGEIVLNSVDRDGTMKGYDLELVAAIREAVHLPLTVLGGAGSLADVKALVDQEGIVGAAAGSLFVFKGKYRAVLINYPNQMEKAQLLPSATRAT
jgi:cyclase